MSQKNKKIAILGGGFSGLGSIAMLKEEGIDSICFEKTDQIGGTWCYREKSVVGVPSIMPTTIINHSKELGALSNFPPSKEFSNYMKHSQLYQYMNDYVEKHDLIRHVKLNTEVILCKKAADYDDTGRWSVTVKDTVTGEVTTDEYDGVVVCVGHINRPKLGSYPGLENFKGKVMHTHSLKGVSDFKGQNVVVIGMGCSGLDAAVEISSVANKVYLSSRSGSHVLNRVGPNGYPIDYILLRKYITQFLNIFPTWLCSWYVRKFYMDQNFDYRLYPVEPRDHLFAKDPVLNDHIFSKLLSGQVIQKRDIARFTEDGLYFESEDQETKIDTVIMATGYDWKFPFLEEGVIVQETDGRINLFKCMWPPHLKHSTLAVVGFILPFGPGFPCGELQCRYVAQVFSGNVKLPSVKVMMKDINRRHAENVARYVPSNKTTVRIDCTQYCDEIAEEIGAKPDLRKIFFTDIRLFLKLVFGPSVSYQYRLKGPHKWDGAREAIMTVDERLHFPLCKDKRKRRKSWFELTEDWMCWIGGLLGLPSHKELKKKIVRE